MNRSGTAFKFIALGVLGGLWGGPAAALAGWADSPLGKAKFGDAWNERPFSAQGLAGKVVLVKVWAEW